MGHYVGIQLMPDWYQRLRGFVVCVVFEATAPSVQFHGDQHWQRDVERHAACYVMWNDIVVYSTGIYFGSVQFQSDHLFLHYISSKRTFQGIRIRAEEPPGRSIDGCGVADLVPRSKVRVWPAAVWDFCLLWGGVLVGS